MHACCVAGVAGIYQAHSSEKLVEGTVRRRSLMPLSFLGVARDFGNVFSPRVKSNGAKGDGDVQKAILAV